MCSADLCPVVCEKLQVRVFCNIEYLQVGEGVGAVDRHAEAFALEDGEGRGKVEGSFGWGGSGYQGFRTGRAARGRFDSSMSKLEHEARTEFIVDEA